MKHRSLIVLWSLLVIAAAGSRAVSGQEDGAFEQGLEAFRASRLQEAIELFTRVIESSSSSEGDRINARINRGSSFLFSGRPKEALTDFAVALEKRPEDASLYLSRGTARGRLNDREGALEDFARALKLNPDYAEVYYNRGRLHGSLGEADRAASDLSAALRLKPGFTEAAILLTQLHASKGRAAEALAVIDANVVVNEHPQALLTRANLLFQLERPAPALKDLSRAIEIAPDFAPAYFNRGFLLSQAGRFQESLADYERALTLMPGDPRTLSGRANALRGLGRLDEALRDYNASLAADPANVESRVNRANLQMARGDLQAAIADFDAAMESGQAPAETAFYRGFAHLGTGAVAAAKKDFATHASRDPEDKYGAIMLFVATARMGEDGAPVLRRFLSGPAAEWADEVIRFLGGVKTKDDFLASIRSGKGDAGQRACEGNYYLGQACLIRGDAACARQHFAAVKETGLIDFLEYQGAAAELRRLASPE